MLPTDGHRMVCDLPRLPVSVECVVAVGTLVLLIIADDICLGSSVVE